MAPSWIEHLKLHTLDRDRAAQVAIASVPLPRDEHAVVTFKGLKSQALPIAWHAGQNGPGLPRQVLLMGIGVPGDEVSLLPASAGDVVAVDSPSAAASSDASWSGPRWSTTIIEEKKTGISMREENELTLEHAGRSLGIRMGIELDGGGFHWWEWMQIERLWTGPICTAFRASGFIRVVDVSEDEMFDPKRYNRGDWLHRHNWLFGEVYAQVFINGLIRVTARHVNNRVFDQGRDLSGLVPIIAFNGAGCANLTPASLDGSRTEFALGSVDKPVHLDVERSTDIVSPEHPGKLWSEAGLAIMRPYEGSEFLLGDGEPAERWRVEAKEKRMWKGMARSFAFDLTFGDRPIHTRRFLPPWGWQAQAGALWPDGTLTARGILEETIDRMIGISAFPDTFHDKVHCVKPMCSGRSFQDTAMWDGEHAHGLMRQAYRTMKREVYDAALHHAYAFADLGMDHADFTHQIGGMPKGSISLVLQRNIGMLAAYLETGDPYLLRCSESMADVAYAIDRSNWPRRSYGRDGAYIRSMTRLYDVTGEAHYLRRAGDACRRATQCQRANGSYADQGGANGVHGHLNEIIKPWMNSILNEVFVDYLERVGSDAVIEAALIRTADWLVSVLADDKDGKYWPYQLAWGKNEFDPTAKFAKDQTPRRHPVGAQQLDYNARTLLWVSRKTGDPKYALAWQATFERNQRSAEPIKSAYGSVKVPDNFPWHEAHLWGAKWDGHKVTLDPFLGAIAVGREAKIELPDGKAVHVKRTASGVEMR